MSFNVFDLDSIECGSSPVPDKPGKARPWQGHSLKEMEPHKRSLIVSPTGSGKALVAMCRGAMKMAVDNTLRHVVIVPQISIAKSFIGGLKIDLEWPGLGKLVWAAPELHVDVRESYTLTNLVEELASSKRAGRRIVCTHQMFVAAFNELELQGKLKCLRDVILTIDEAHHSSAGESEELVFDEEMGTNLGKIVHYYFKKDLHLDMFTATDFRTDRSPLIPMKAKVGKDYGLYVRDWGTHIQEMDHLKEMKYRYWLGTPEAAIAAMLDEHQGKTIAYLPPTTSDLMKLYGSKEELLKLLDPIAKNKNMNTVELVTSDDAYAALMGSPTTPGLLEKGSNLDLVWAQNRMIEGTDWPDAMRGILINPRGILSLIQMNGRFLRDVEGKSEVEFNIIIPDDKSESVQDRLNKHFTVFAFALLTRINFAPPNASLVKRVRLGDRIKALESAINAAAVGDSQRIQSALVEAIGGEDLPYIGRLKEVILNGLSVFMVNVDSAYITELRRQHKAASFTLPIVEGWCRKFFIEYNLRPTPQAYGARRAELQYMRYDGHDLTWGAINSRCVKIFGKTIRQICDDIGLAGKKYTKADEAETIKRTKDRAFIKGTIASKDTANDVFRFSEAKKQDVRDLVSSVLTSWWYGKPMPERPSAEEFGTSYSSEIDILKEEARDKRFADANNYYRWKMQADASPEQLAELFPELHKLVNDGLPDGVRRYLEGEDTKLP